MSVTDQTIVTLIPGDGIGPEVSEAVMKIIDASGANIQWDIVNAGADVFEKTGQLVPNDVYESIELNKIALKGPITTPVGSGFRSINVMLRKNMTSTPTLDQFRVYQVYKPLLRILTSSFLEKTQKAFILALKKKTQTELWKPRRLSRQRGLNG